jgi:UDP-glucose 4-epimerase
VKYLITGHKGFIGTNLINYLQERNEKVIGLDYPDDLCERVAEPLDIDIVIHLAAETNVRKSIINSGNFLRNCKSTYVALEYARINYAKFIFASSCGAANPINPYSASKLAGEAICKAYRESYMMDISILRFANVYGPYSKHKDSVIAKFIKQKLNNEPVTINGSGHQTRDFIHVQDICKAIYTAHEDFSTIATGHLTSVNSIIEMLNIKDVIYDSPIEGEIFHPETERWSGCEVKLEQGLAETLKWFEEN